MESKRTEGPWKRSKENAYSILTPQGGLIAKTSYHWVDPVSARLNAAFIVKACNEYEELRAVLENLLSDVRALATRSEVNVEPVHIESWFPVLRAKRMLQA